MTADEVHTLLEAQRDERGAAHWNARYPDSPLRCVGLGLTRLRKLAKQVGRDHDLSQQLWTSDLYEAKVLALLIDEPARITRDQAETQVEQLEGGQLAHVFSSCDASLAKAPIAQELAVAWMQSEDPVRQGCGYSLLAELAKSKKKSAPDEDWFAGWLEHIDAHRGQVDVDTQLAMGAALMTLGKRTARLNARAVAIAEAMGPIDWDPTGACAPFEVLKHIDNPRVRKKLGIEGSAE